MAGWWKGGQQPPSARRRSTTATDDDEPFDLDTELLDAILRELRSIKAAVWWLVAFVVIGFAAAVLVAISNAGQTP